MKTGPRAPKENAMKTAARAIVDACFATRPEGEALCKAIDLLELLLDAGVEAGPDAETERISDMAAAMQTAITQKENELLEAE